MLTVEGMTRLGEAGREGARLMATQEDSTALARALQETFNGRDYDRLDDLVAQNVQWVNVATGETFSGPEGVRQFMQG
jgi:SnoaL-like domain